jgi:hypothetical protein
MSWVNSAKDVIVLKAVDFKTEELIMARLLIEVS